MVLLSCCTRLVKLVSTQGLKFKLLMGSCHDALYWTMGTFNRVSLMLRFCSRQVAMARSAKSRLRVVFLNAMLIS
jgi:hypothetical protein